MKKSKLRVIKDYEKLNDETKEKVVLCHRITICVNDVSYKPNSVTLYKLVVCNFTL
jgi:hypothetical protein